MAMGRPLVLLHGFVGDSREWRQQLEGLSDEFTVVAWDAPGCGRSSDPGATITVVSGDLLSAVFDPKFRERIVTFFAGVDERTGAPLPRPADRAVGPAPPL
jgi:pimeloyl-ACP methyl ester carboxylesterase